jgi:hypothetical protein
MIMSDFGIDSLSPTQKGLIAGEYHTMVLPADEDATVATGQVFEYNAGEHNWKNRTSGVSAPPYVVCFEDKAITADTPVVCIVRGSDVDISKLDATNAAEPDTKAALLISGIRALTVI